MIAFQGVHFGYGKRPLFSSLDLQLSTGNMYGLLGLNGAGKTSLLKLAAGALRPSQGQITVMGRCPGERSAEHLADIYFVPEDPWVPAITRDAWLKRYAGFRPAFDQEHFRMLAQELALDPAKPLHQYSYGQRKKFALAVALASNARVLLLDEPTNGLDIPSKVQLRRLLASAIAPERVVIISTHQMRDLEHLMDPVVVVHGGKILFTLSSEALAAHLTAAHLSSLEGQPVIYAEKTALGWSTLLHRSNAVGEQPAPDMELVFNAAIAAPLRLQAALQDVPLSPYDPDLYRINQEV